MPSQEPSETTEAAKPVVYYNLDKLLNTTDLDGEKPGIYIVTSNRSAGKTFAVKQFCLDEWLEHKRRFIMIVRYSYSLNSAHLKFSDIQALPEYENLKFKTKKLVLNHINSLECNGELCGFVVSLNRSYDAIKDHSSIFQDVDNMFFDEFQPESEKFVKDEYKIIYTLSISAARGRGSQSRYIRLFLMGNNVSLINPYYLELGVTDRLRPNTKILRGHGWVLEVTHNESASEAVASNPITKAFAHTKIAQYSQGQVYLNDDSAFVQRPSGRGQFLIPVIYENEKFGIWRYPEYLYVCKKVEPSSKIVYAADLQSHNENTMLMTKNSPIVKTLMRAVASGSCRFQDLVCKNLVLTILRLK